MSFTPFYSIISFSSISQCHIFQHRSFKIRERTSVCVRKNNKQIHRLLYEKGGRKKSHFQALRIQVKFSAGAIWLIHLLSAPQVNPTKETLIIIKPKLSLAVYVTIMDDEIILIKNTLYQWYRTTIPILKNICEQNEYSCIAQKCLFFYLFQLFQLVSYHRILFKLCI